MQKTITLLPPSMPNFIAYELGREKQQPMIPIESLNEDEASAYGELMKQSFIKHWRRKKASSKELK